MSATVVAPPAVAPRSGGDGRLRRMKPLLGVAPFLLYTALFLLVPTAIVVIGAFQGDGGSFTLANFSALFGQSVILEALLRSIVLSVVSAVIGAVVGAVVAYFLSTAPPSGLLRKLVTSASSVLAQFSGVMLAFAFIFSFTGRTGLVSRTLNSWFGVPEPDVNYFASLIGLIIVYAYFQIPLMVIIFLPAVDGIRPQWREATESLGGSTWVFWRRVAGPLLTPSFLGALLLLFANAFSAFATAAALVGLGSPLITLQISNALTSETGLGAPNLAKAEALIMVVIVAIVMAGYYWIQKRSSRWLG
ncbi:putative spermidine/putrescine transport system permease protein [Nakamurella sp. UYEF19]|uniref:ABC transporter permease n=1 Tax=Nakamurella sp. UYEF19 TaxID=1756392 RepID=UPI0033979D65